MNAQHSDISAVILGDDELVAAVEEERFRRVWRWVHFPREAIRPCVEMSSVALGQVDHLTI
jgi:carbamoyltransferase